MMVARDQRYNVVIVPVSAFGAGLQRFQLSASRGDRGSFLVSPEWTDGEVRGALGALGLSGLQMEELFRGNRMAFGGRDSRLMLFEEEALLGVGLVERVVVPVAS